MSNKDLITYLSSKEFKQRLNQLDIEIVQAFSKIFQSLPTQSSEEIEPGVIPPKTAKEFIEWLPTKAGKKYLDKVDPKFLQAYVKLLAFGPPIIHRPTDPQ